MVEHNGFEPLTSSMPWKRATNCANAPYVQRYGNTKIAPIERSDVCCLAVARPPEATLFVLNCFCFLRAKSLNAHQPTLR